MTKTLKEQYLHVEFFNVKHHEIKLHQERLDFIIRVCLGLPSIAEIKFNHPVDIKISWTTEEKIRR